MAASLVLLFFTIAAVRIMTSDYSSGLWLWSLTSLWTGFFIQCFMHGAFSLKIGAKAMTLAFNVNDLRFVSLIKVCELYESPSQIQSRR